MKNTSYIRIDLTSAEHALIRRVAAGEFRSAKAFAKKATIECAMRKARKLANEHEPTTREE